MTNCTFGALDLTQVVFSISNVYAFSVFLYALDLVRKAKFVFAFRFCIDQEYS